MLWLFTPVSVTTPNGCCRLTINWWPSFFRGYIFLATVYREIHGVCMNDELDWGLGSWIRNLNPIFYRQYNIFKSQLKMWNSKVLFFLNFRLIFLKPHWNHNKIKFQNDILIIASHIFSKNLIHDKHWFMGLNWRHSESRLCIRNEKAKATFPYLSKFRYSQKMAARSLSFLKHF